jgi:hypothetical protein
MKSIVVERRSLLFGALAGVSLLAGGLAWHQDAQSRRMQQQASSMLLLLEQGRLDKIEGPYKPLMPARDSLENFEREKGRAERFEINTVQHVLGIGPAYLSGLVTRRGQRFGFGMVLSSSGRPANYHEWPLAAPKE